MMQNAILTRDVMRRKQWDGNPQCSFCREQETVTLVFFLCPVARASWRIVASVLGMDRCPNTVWQFYSWCFAFFPEVEVFYTVGLAAICWAIWNLRNRATFE